MIVVKLVDHSHDPIKSLYTGYRIDYSPRKPEDIEQAIETGAITREQMEAFIEVRLKTGHTSPLEQVWFEFSLSGVSRAFSHQFVRHHTGISFEQQSQRYVSFAGKEFEYVTPRSIVQAGMDYVYDTHMGYVQDMYDQLIEQGIPQEDARFVIPNACCTNFKFVVNFAELQHICDLRLCTRAQWEFRKVFAMVRAEINKKFPLLAKYLQPKCGENRMGFCDETLKDWKACPVSASRPHKSLFMVPLVERSNHDLTDADFGVIENG